MASLYFDERVLAVTQKVTSDTTWNILFANLFERALRIDFSKSARDRGINPAETMSEAFIEAGLKLAQTSNKLAAAIRQDAAILEIAIERAVAETLVDIPEDPLPFLSAQCAITVAETAFLTVYDRLSPKL